jgi:hypothetical protein
VLAGAYRLGKRPIRQLTHDLFGLSISTGMIAKLERATADALAQPMTELEAHIRTQPANVDETSWREAGRRAWLWVVVTPLVSVFRIAGTRGGQVVRDLLGPGYRRVVTSDRWTAYNRFRRRQLCWSPPPGLPGHDRPAEWRGRHRGATPRPFGPDVLVVAPCAGRDVGPIQFPGVRRLAPVRVP